MQGFDGLENKPKPEPAPERQAAPEKPDSPEKVEKVEPKAKAEPSRAEPKPDKDPVRLRMRLAEMEKSEREKAAKITEYERKISDIEAKSTQTEADAKKVQALEEQLKRLQGEISLTAYERSDEFKARHVDPFNRAWTNTLSLVKQLAVENEDGTKRQATDADFMRVARAPIGDQAQIATELFGSSASLVLQKIGRLQEMKEQADGDVEAHRNDYDKRTQEQARTQKAELDQFNTHYKSAKAELAQKYAQFFGEDESDPEGNQALRDGWEFVEQARDNTASRSAEERAAYAAVIGARAAATLRLIVQNNRLKEKLDGAEKELAQYRKSDPGDAGNHGSPAADATKDRPKGIAGLSAQF